MPDPPTAGCPARSLEKVQHWFSRTLRPVRPRSPRRFQKRPLVPAFAPRACRSAARLTLLGHGKRQRRAFANYLSIPDRYNGQSEFDARNTIGRQFRSQSSPSRKHGFSVSPVADPPQWQNGDTMLNFKLATRRSRGQIPRHRISGELTRRRRSVRERQHVNRAIRASTYPLGALRGAGNSVVPGSGGLFSCSVILMQPFRPTSASGFSPISSAHVSKPSLRCRLSTDPRS